MVFKKGPAKNEALNVTTSLREALEGDGVLHSLSDEIKSLASNEEGTYRLEQLLVDHNGRLKEVVFNGKHYR